MLGQLLKFELKLQTKQVGFWVVLVIMFLLGVGTPWLTEVLGSGMAGEKIKANGAQMVAGSVASWDTAAMFFTAIFVVSGILRDKDHNMLEIVHSTPVSTFDMTGSRMIGIYLTVLACIFANTLGQFLGQFNPQIDKETLGPINPLFYLQPMIVFTAVNALVFTAFFTFVAGVTQNRMLVFVSAIGLFFVSIMTGMVTELDVPKWAQALVDPFGGIAYVLETEFWTPEERNTRMLPVFSYLGLNRLVWGFASLLVLAAVFGKFKRGIITGKTKLKNAAVLAAKDAPPYRPVRARSGFGSDFAAFIARFKFEYFTTLRSIPFIILASLAAVLFAFIIIVAVFLSPQKLVPTSMFMVSIGFTSFTVPIVFIIAFFSGEIIWRDKSAKFSELLDSTAVKNWPIVTGKWLALSAIIATLCLIPIIIGMAVQVLVDGPPINVALYFKFTFLSVFPNYLALTLLALFVQTFMPNRIVGMLAAATAMVFFTFAVGRLPFYHPLMGFSGTSPGSISEISPYGNWVYFRWFNLYFGALCVLFAVISTWLWRRGLQTPLIGRMKKMRQHITPASGTLAAISLATFIGCGMYIFSAYNTVDWQNRKHREAAQVEGEKLTAREFKLAIPKIQSVDVNADIYPSRQEATVKGSFVLKNISDAPITEVYISPASRHAEDIRQLEIDGAEWQKEGQNADGDNVEDFEDYNLAVFKFTPPLMPDAETQMRFETFFHAPRLADRSSINKNGTFMSNGDFGSARALPLIGVPDLRLRNPDKRRKYELPELEKRADRTDMDARQRNFFTPSGDYIDLKATVCTDADQIPIAPGDFVGETIDGDRRCRSYESDRPINNFFSFLSGKYAVTEDSWISPDGKVIPITVYHGKNHTYSVQTMIDAVKFGLEHYSESFGPYQYNYVRIMEVPFIGFAQAFAGTIPFTEQGFIMDSGEPDDVSTLDSATHITMHEIAHQWFAHQIVGADTRGFNVLSEGLTSYAAMDAYEEKYGWDKARYALEKSTIDQMIALAMFDRSKEVPLAVAGEQQYLVYNKADWVLWSLKHYIGREKVYEAMQNFLKDYGQTGPPYPTTLQLIEYLREAAGPDYDQLITDQWDRMTYWDLAYGEADISVSPNADGTFTVNIPFKLDKKISTEEESKQISVTELDEDDLNEWVEIGIYANEPKDKWSDWTTLEKIRVNQPSSTLSFVVKERPGYIALDPRRLLQEKNITDNVKKVDPSKS